MNTRTRRKEHRGFFRGLAAGMVIGGLLTGAVAAEGGLGYKIWDKYGPWFREGYVVGFLDALEIAKRYDPYGYFSKNWAYPRESKPGEWREHVEKLFADEANRRRPVSQLMAITGNEMVKRHGPEEELTKKQLDFMRRILSRKKPPVKSDEPDPASSSGDPASEPAGEPGAAEGSTTDGP